jgi:hypothetical protein
VVSGSPPNFLALEVSDPVSAAPIPDGPIPLRGRIMGAVPGEPVGEIVVWVERGRLSGLEHVRFNDDTATALPGPERLDVVLVPDRAANASAPGPGAADLPVEPSGAQVLAREHGFDLASNISTTDVVLPQSFDERPWAEIQRVLKLSSYDLRPYAGQKVKLTTYGIDSKAGGRAPHGLVYIERGKCIGAYTHSEGTVSDIGGLP